MTDVFTDAAFAELGRIDLHTADLPGVLDRVAHLACEMVPGADEVSASLLRGGQAHTPAFTGQLALGCDERQYLENGGPCLRAAQTGNPTVVEDFATEQRWPGYAQAAYELGAGSSLSLPLPLQEAQTGALNLYARAPHAFSPESIEVATRFAAFAAVIVSNVRLYASTAQLAQQMQEAMTSRAVIEQAKGIIMSQRRCGSEEAFAVLQEVSQRSNRKLREIAEGLVSGVQSAG